jgi:hypothetical protein
MAKRAKTSAKIFSLIGAIVILTISAVGYFVSRSTLPDIHSVRGQIEHLQTLTTSQYEYRDVVFFDEQTRLLGIPAGNREMLFAIRIEVIAGLDLSRSVTVEPGRDRREVFVTLPPPEIIRVVAREDSIDQYFVRPGFRGIDWLDVSDRIEEAKDRNRTDAIDRGILDRARSHGEFVIRGLLQAAGFETVHIRFRSSPGEGLQG